MLISMIEQCRIEVDELHQFFEDWFNAELPNTEEAFSRFSGVMQEQFQMVPPSAVMSSRSILLDGLRGAYGIWTTKRPGWKIFVKNFDGRMLGEGICLVTYEEWQGASEEEVQSRRSTAIFRNSEGKPNNVEWLHVHETWINQ